MNKNVILFPIKKTYILREAEKLYNKTIEVYGKQRWHNGFHVGFALGCLLSTIAREGLFYLFHILK